MRCSVYPSIVAVGALVLAIGALSLAQYQVNRQIYGSAGPSTAVRYQPAWSSAMPSVPKSSTLLPSETRNYMAKSGMLPSDLRANYARVGPLAPQGAISYIPPAPTYRAPSAGPSGNRVNTMAGSSGAAAPSAAASPFSSSNPGSVRYGGAAPLPGSLAFSPGAGGSGGGGINASLSPTAVTASAGGPALGFGTSSSYGSGSVRYSSP